MSEAKAGKNQRKTVDGIHFIRVHGTMAERAKAHGELLRDEIRDGALPHLAKKNEWLIRRGPGLVAKAPVQNSIVWLYKNVLIPLLDRQSDAETKAVVNAVCDATGLRYEDARESLFQPDAMMLLSRTSMMRYLLRDLPRGGLPGCTSAVALKEQTRAGRMLVARNQDYPVLGPWEKHTTVIFNEPTEPGHIPHVSVTTAGVHTAGLTTMNREGLTLNTHAHFGREVSFRGKPVIWLGNEIARKAKTIGEAVDIARKHRRHANWAYVVSSAKENDAAVIEMTPTRTQVRHAKDGFIGHTNFFHAPELQKSEALLSGGCCDDLVTRLCRMLQIIREKAPDLVPGDLTRALGDHIDYHTGAERVFGNTVSVVTTIKSVVFEPETQRLWISNRGESPMGLGDFVEVDTQRFWDRSESEGPLPKLEGYRPRDPALIEGVRHYREAYRVWHCESHTDDFAERTLIALRKAIRAYPSDGNLWVQAGIVAFHQHQFEEAKAYLEQALQHSLVPHIALVRDLYLARACDVSGERARAVGLYARYELAEEPKLRAALKRGMRKAFKKKETLRMMVDLQFPDTFQY